MDGRRRAVAGAAVGPAPGGFTAFPPGPPPSLGTLFIYGPGRDPLRFFSSLASYGDLAYARVAREHLYYVGDPRVVRDIFVTHQHKFIKGRGLDRAKRFLGE